MFQSKDISFHTICRSWNRKLYYCTTCISNESFITKRANVLKSILSKTILPNDIIETIISMSIKELSDKYHNDISFHKINHGKKFLQK